MKSSNFKAAVWSGLFFGICMGILIGFISGWTAGLTAGIGAGLFFGLGIGSFVALMSRRMAGRLPLQPGEEILKEGPANHMYHGESVGGWLTLTNQRLHFTSHKINVQVHEWSAPLYQIAKAATVATAGIVPNGLRITLDSGQTEHFVVSGRAEWVNALAQTKGLRV